MKVSNFIASALLTLSLALGVSMAVSANSTEVEGQNSLQETVEMENKDEKPSQEGSQGSKCRIWC